MNSINAKQRKRKTASTVSKKDERSILSATKNSLKGSLLGLLLSVILLFAISVILLQTQDPCAYGSALSYSMLILCAFVSGLAATKINRGDSMLCGMISGAIFFVFIFIVSLFLGPSESIGTGVSIALRTAAIPASIAGACLGEKRKKPRRNKRH